MAAQKGKDLLLKLDDGAGVDDGDQVGAAQRAEAVRDDEDGGGRRSAAAGPLASASI